MGLTFAELTETALGPLSFVAGDRGLQRVAFSPLNVLKAEAQLVDVEPSLLGLETLGELIGEMNEFLFGIRKLFSVTIDWDVLSGFQKQVLMLTAGIPFGQYLTYGGIAQQLGKPGAARAIGRALRDNPMPIVIPCHRVIGSDGRLVGYEGGLDAKAFLLRLEGHKVAGGRVVVQ